MEPKESQVSCSPASGHRSMFNELSCRAVEVQGIRGIDGPYAGRVRANYHMVGLSSSVVFFLRRVMLGRCTR